MDFKLKDDEVKKLESLHKKIKDGRIRDRIKCIVALSRGYSFEEIEEILLIDERTARRYFKIYKDKGEEGLLILNYEGKKPKLSQEQEEELKEHIRNNLYSRAIDIMKYIKDKYNITYTREGVVILLHRLGFSYKKTKAIPGKSDVEKQKKHLEKYEKLRKSLKKEEKIYFMDAVHPTYNVMPAYAWIEEGKNKEIKSNTGRERVNINGVYSPIDNEIIVRREERINAQSTIELFKEIESKHSELNKIYIICDNAKYYNCSLIKEYLKTSKIELIHLPTYSPNLNLIERLWGFLKKKVIYNKYYDTKNNFIFAIDNFFNTEIKNHIEEIKSLLTENFHIFSSA